MFAVSSETFIQMVTRYMNNGKFISGKIFYGKSGLSGAGTVLGMLYQDSDNKWHGDILALHFSSTAIYECNSSVFTVKRIVNTT